MIVKNTIKKDFTIVPNSLWSLPISCEAKCLYGYLASKPNDWNVCNFDVKRALGIKGTKRDRIARIWNELIECGIVEKIRHQNNVFTIELKDIKPLSK